MSDKTVLFILGSHPYLKDGKTEAGWFLPEAAHPYYVVSKSYNVEWASIEGGAAPLDPTSVEMFKEDEESQQFLKDETAQKGVKNTLKISEVDASKYAAIFVCFESENADAIKLYEAFWNAGKLTSAVCHGPAALAEVKDKDGKSIFAGRKATGFTNTEEEQVKKTHQVPWLLEDKMKELGAHFEKAKEPWSACVQQDGLLLTDKSFLQPAYVAANSCARQNPASAKGVGEHIVKWLQAH